MSRMILGRDTDLTPTRKTVDVDIDELGCAVRLRELTAAQIENVDKSIVAQLALMIVDESGNQVFTTVEDINRLSQMGFRVTMRLWREGAKLNGISQEKVDETIKNSAAAPSIDSASA